MSEIDDLTGDSNNGAFRKNEIRNGPPLSYVAEKVRISIETIHGIYYKAKNRLPDSNEKAEMISDSCYAFRNSIVSYLALYNLLALVEDNDVYENLLNSSKEDLDNWLDVVEREGSLL